MEIDRAKQLKATCIAELNTAMQKPCYFLKVAEIDSRLSEYIYDCIDTQHDNANLYELLGIRKFLRMLCTYQFRIEKVQRIYRMYEALKFDGLQGKRSYRLTPTQCFELAAPFGFDYALITDPSPERPRQLCREANYFIPRKASKTTLAAFFNFYYFFFGDNNAEIYCMANSFEQSKRLYNYTYDLVHQMDPEEKDIRFTQKGIDWRNHDIRQSCIVPLSAGGKTKDGMFPQLCCEDEYGSATYVKDHSDMANLVGVVQGGMGPRWEPMTVITTTAGRMETGPYRIKLDGILATLVDEMDYPLDGEPHQRKDCDWQFALVCQPDIWEDNDEDLHRPELWRKVNRHLGITVQPDYYENQLQEMDRDPEKYAEQRCKLFNLWTVARSKQWLKASDIYPLQQPIRITDLRSQDGWICFVGMDFSKHDDLSALSYLAYNRRTGAFFADCDAFLPEYYMETNANRELYNMWVDMGYLHVCPGKTISEEIVTARIIEISRSVVIMRIGYDKYDAARFVNAISAWIFSKGQDPKMYLRPVSQTFASFNSPVQELTFMIQNDPPLITFSNAPLWPWEFSNAMLMESSDGMENVKIVKSSQLAKVDNIHCLISCIVCFDEMNGTINNK